MNASSAVIRTTHRTLLTDAHLYLYTDSRASRGDLHEFLHACYEGGTDIIQLHDKRIDTRDEIAAVKALAEVAAEHGKLFTVNDRTDIAALTSADILHVGQEDLIAEQARQIVGPEVPIGRSNRNLDIFAASLADGGIDYAVIGPVYATPTKPDRQPVEIDIVREAAVLVRRVRTQDSAGSRQNSVANIVHLHGRSANDPVKPWWVIGGINAETAGEVIGAGAERIVVIRALIEATNPEETVRTLRAAVTGVGGIDNHGGK